LIEREAARTVTASDRPMAADPQVGAAVMPARTLPAAGDPDARARHFLLVDEVRVIEPGRTRRSPRGRMRTPPGPIIAPRWSWISRDEPVMWLGTNGILFLDLANARRGKTVRLGDAASIENLLAWLDA
jgi:hypothetical protein